jgi:hypothetical protein
MNPEEDQATSIDSKEDQALDQEYQSKTLKRKKPSELMPEHVIPNCTEIGKDSNPEEMKQCTANHMCPVKKHKTQGIFAMGHQTQEESDDLPLLNHILLVLTTVLQNHRYICTHCCTPGPQSYGSALDHARNMHGNMLGYTFNKTAVNCAIKTIIAERRMNNEPFSYTCIFCQETDDTPIEFEEAYQILKYWKSRNQEIKRSRNQETKLCGSKKDTKVITLKSIASRAIYGY